MLPIIVRQCRRRKRQVSSFTQGPILLAALISVPFGSGQSQGRGAAAVGPIGAEALLVHESGRRSGVVSLALSSRRHQQIILPWTLSVDKVGQGGFLWHIETSSHDASALAECCLESRRPSSRTWARILEP